MALKTKQKLQVDIKKSICLCGKQTTDHHLSFILTENETSQLGSVSNNKETVKQPQSSKHTKLPF